MIDLYTAATSNGYRCSIMLEVCALPYRTIAVDLAAGAHLDAAFLAINPMGQIPAIDDPDGPDGAPLRLGESLAILRYLAEKSGRLLPANARDRAEADRWCALIGTGVQPNFSAIYFAQTLVGDAAKPLTDKFMARILRALPPMENRLSETEWLAGSALSYADIFALPVILTSFRQFDISLDDYPAITAWRDRLSARADVQRGLASPA